MSNNVLGFQLQNYLLLYKNETSTVFKKNKKKLSKQNIFKQYDFKMYKYEELFIDELKKYLILMKKQRNIKETNSIKALGILLDTNRIILDIINIPPLPKEFDILCLECQIKKYKSENNQENVYWTPVDIFSTGHFVINYNSIDKILNIINTCKSNSEFFDKINEINIYTVTQYNFSENSDYSVAQNTTIYKNKSQEELIAQEMKIYNECFNKIQKLIKTPTNNYELNKFSQVKDALLPGISLICPFTNLDNFYHCLLTFESLNYPRHLLELIIVDDTNSEKKLGLPEDSRIKLINITQDKSNNFDCHNEKVIPLALGYKINAGVKFAQKNIIMHLFDTNNYTLNLKKIVLSFILSNKQCMVSRNTLILNKINEFKIHEFNEYNLPDIANMIYTKDFWSKMAFDQNGYLHSKCLNIDVILKWISNRINEIEFTDCYSQKIKNILYKEIKENDTQISLNLIDEKLIESLKLLL